MSSYTKNGIQSTVGSIIRKAENDYTNGTTTISKYVNKSMYEDINRTDAYLNSKHISGETDALGREKPFFNIVTAAVNIWYRSTVIYLNKIKIKATKSTQVILAFIATVHLHVFFKKANFKGFLNDWGRALARYGSSVIKFVEKGGELIVEVVPWNRLIVDAVDFDSNPVIEVLELTEAQLYKRKGYDKDMVQKLCDARMARQLLDGQTQDNKSDYIKLYEIHGELPLSEITGKEEDQDTYVQQMHVVSFVAGKEDGEFDDYTLVSGREDNTPYMITHLIKEDGQTLSIGAVQHLFEAQWMVNHSMKLVKDQLDLASKLIFQTADENFLGQNALDAIETGDILIHKPGDGMRLEQVQNNSHDITSLQNFGNTWKALSNEIAGISESMLGNAAPSGTAWRQVEAILQESHSLFEVMTDNKATYLEIMFRERIIPYIKKKMDTSEEITATLDDYDIQKIDSIYIKKEATKKANREILNRALKGERVTPEEQALLTQESESEIKNGLDQMGSQRFFVPSEVETKTWNSMLKDFEWEVEVDVTDNDIDKDAMTTFTSMLAFFAKKNGQPLTPEERFVVNKILVQSGIVSPVELPTASSTPAPAAPVQTIASPLQNPVAPQRVT